MDYNKRLQELDSKLERESLTDNEQAEVKLIYSKSLRALQQETKAMLRVFDNQNNSNYN